MLFYHWNWIFVVQYCDLLLMHIPVLVSQKNIKSKKFIDMSVFNLI